jgi:phage regulator Rha-like protein
MKNLLNLTGELTMSSVEVADLTGKQHKHVLRDIETVLRQLEKDGSNLSHGFKPGDYVAGNGRRERCYYLTQDATILLNRYHADILVLSLIKQILFIL